MKFSMLFISMMAMSGSAFSAVDYSYCQKQFNVFVQPNKPCKTGGGGMFTMCGGGGYGDYKNEKTKDSSFYPFELAADGKVIPHPTLNYKNEEGKEIVSSKNKDMDYETIISRNDKGEITNIETSYAMKTQPVGMNYGGFGVYGSGAPAKTQSKAAAFVRRNESNTKIEIKNGKCIPSRIDTVNSLGDESRQDVNFDANLCRNISQFFKKNPEAASCFDKGLMDKANEIFNEYYKSNKDVYGDVDTDNPYSKPKALRTKLKSDINLGGMYGYPGSGIGGGMGVGMGMGMPGATTEQMLTPMMLSVDSTLKTTGFYQPGAGFGNTPVVQAMQIMTLCQGGGFGQSILSDVVNDESIWKAEAQSASRSEATQGIQK